MPFKHFKHSQQPKSSLQSGEQLPRLKHRVQNTEVIRTLTRGLLTTTLDGFPSMRVMHLRISMISTGPIRDSCPRLSIYMHQLKNVKTKLKNHPT